MPEPLVSARDTAVFDGLMSRIFLARAEYALGDDAAARRLIAEAQEIDQAARGQHVTALIERIENEMQALPSGAVLIHQDAPSLSGIAL